jgi:hypothetical protein
MGAFSVGFSAWIAHAVFRYSLPGVAVHSALAFLLAGAACRLAGAAGARLPPPQVPFTREAVVQGAAAFGAAAGGWVERANVLLKWEDGAASARALAYAYLAYVCLWAVSAASVLAAWLVAFVVVPLYVQFQGPVDGALAAVAAACKRAAAALGATGAALGGAFASPYGSLKVGGAGCVAAYVLWGLLPGFSTMVLGAWERLCAAAVLPSVIPPPPPPLSPLRADFTKYNTLHTHTCLYPQVCAFPSQHGMRCMQWRR